MSSAVIQTLWTKDSLRCLLLKELHPVAYTVVLFDGGKRISTDVVIGPNDAVEVAALLRAMFTGCHA
ncbi:MAG TPA: hypothetical protein VH417_16630 [Vicinamibacterales bacterium]